MGSNPIWGSDFFRVLQKFNLSFISYFNLGSVHKNLGHLSQAKDYHDRALAVRLKKLRLDRTKVAAACNNSGLMHHNLDYL